MHLMLLFELHSSDQPNTKTIVHIDENETPQVKTYSWQLPKQFYSIQTNYISFKH